MLEPGSDAFDSKAFLPIGITLLVLLLMFLGFYVHAIRDQPEITGEPLATTEGVFHTIAASTQRGTTFIVKRKDDGKLMKLSVLPAAAHIRSGFSASKGRNIILQHYGTLVVSCRVDGVELCSPKCFSEQGCKKKLHRSSVSILQKMVCTIAVVFVAYLALYLFKRNRRLSAAFRSR